MRLISSRGTHVHLRDLAHIHAIEGPAQISREGGKWRTVLGMSLSATGPGSEVERRLAAVVIGGLIIPTLLALVALPAQFARIQARAWPVDERAPD